MRFIDRLLVSRSGVASPKGPTREIKQAYVDFWSFLETIRAHMASGDYWSQPYTADFAGALTLDGQLYCPGAKERLVLGGVVRYSHAMRGRRLRSLPWYVVFCRLSPASIGLRYWAPTWGFRFNCDFGISEFYFLAASPRPGISCGIITIRG